MYKLTQDQEYFQAASESNILSDFIVSKLHLYYLMEQGDSWVFGNFYNYITYLIGEVLTDTKLFSDKKKSSCTSSPFINNILETNRKNIFAEFFVDSLHSVISHSISNTKTKKQVEIFSVRYYEYKNVQNVVNLFSKYLYISEDLYSDGYIITGIKNKNMLISVLKKNSELFRAMMSFIVVNDAETSLSVKFSSCGLRPLN